MYIMYIIILIHINIYALNIGMCIYFLCVIQIIQHLLSNYNLAHKSTKTM